MMSLRRTVLPLLIALVVLVAGLAATAWVPIRNARRAWQEGRNAEAIETADNWSRLRLWSTQYHQLLAAALLTVGNVDAAKPHLAAISGGRVWIPAINKSEVARRFFARGKYAEFLLYDDASRELKQADDVLLYRAAALAAVGRITEAESLFRDLDKDDYDKAKVDALERALVQRKEGSAPYVLDRDGKTIAAYHFANADVVPINADFAPLVDREGGPLTIEAQLRRLGANDTIETTLDSAVQKAAMNALGGFKGAIVAIDPKTNEVLAIASTGGRENRALEQMYEPGSVMKVLTGLEAVSSGMDVKSMFPYTCTGNLNVDGRQFGDWVPTGHGVLNTFDDALAQSCNVVFADIGIRRGRDNLKAFYDRAGFDGKTTLGLFEVPLGRTVGPIFNKFETGFYAIGLEHETINALHLAMLASMMANRGTLTTPRLLRGRRSVLGEAISGAAPQSTQQVAPRAAAERMVQAMTAVATHPHGSGRRAPIDGVSLAVKTGTAGKRENGYHALIMAFAPVESPKIAFGVIAEDAGPAEFSAAKIAHDFMEGIRGRL